MFESGKLTLPGGVVFNGEFSLTFAETDAVQYYQMGDQTNLAWSPEPYIFHGTISSINGTNENVWALEHTLTGRPILIFEPELGRENHKLWYYFCFIVVLMIILGEFVFFFSIIWLLD